MAKKDDGFLTNKPTNLADDLKPTEVSRLLARDIERRQSLPFSITGGARKTGVMVVYFYANASAGDFTETIDLDYQTVPLASVWHLGSKDKTGYIMEGGGTVTGSFNAASSNVDGYTVFSGAHANFTVTKNQLLIGITSTNVGWAPLIAAYFFYSIYYDDTQVATYGL